LHVPFDAKRSDEPFCGSHATEDFHVVVQRGL
jgi:hypothetical protein